MMTTPSFKKRLLSVVLMLLPFVLAAQQKISITAFTMDPLDQAAKTYAKKDVNGDLYALIKVRPACDDFIFKFGYMKSLPDEVRHPGETWIYVQKNARRISMSGEGYEPLMNEDLGQTLNEGTTYILEWKASKPKEDETPAMTWQFVLFRVAAPDAVVRVNGKSLKPKDGVVTAKLPFGRHEYDVSAPMYESSHGLLIADASQPKQEVLVEMIPLFKEVTLTAADGVEIYIDGEKKGTGRWTGPMEFSNYSIECRKGGYRPSQQDIVISKDGPSSYELKAPEPMYASLVVETEPADSEIYLDGQRQGTTPTLLQKVLAGRHELRIVKAGYEALTQTLDLKENDTQTVSGELKKSLGAGLGSASASGGQAVAGKRTYTVNGVSFTMVAVSGGTFTMGATKEQGSDAYSDEKPAHQVTLSDFAIGETEVTQELWQAVMGNNPSNFKGSNRPVECVSWDDCQEFISKLNALTGQSFRLPTEAEWEYAARGGSQSRGYKHSGGNIIDDVAVYSDNSGSQTHPVKSKQANELGLYDMSGNVWEWCSDWYGSYSSSAQRNPTGASNASYRVDRGGSWALNARRCRVSRRLSNSPGYRGNDLGLRLAQ